MESGCKGERRMDNDFLVEKTAASPQTNSNRAEQLQPVIKDWAEIYKASPKLDGKTFKWKQLLAAAN